MERVLWLLGWAKGLTSLGTGARTSGDRMNCNKRSSWPHWAERAGGSQGRGAGKCASPVSPPGHPLGSGAARGWEEGLSRALSLPSPRLWTCCCNREPLLSQRRAITHWQNPRQLLPVPG